MGEFNDILERMRDARERWSTVRATLLKCHDLALGEEALEFFIAQEPPGSVGRLTRPGDSKTMSEDGGWRRSPHSTKQSYKCGHASPTAGA